MSKSDFCSSILKEGQWNDFRSLEQEMDAYISGVGMTKFGKSSEPLESLMAEAALGALKDAGLEEVDAARREGLRDHP